MKIYTKKGDKGKTSLYGGGTVDKHHKQVQAYGNIDELNAYIGWIRTLGIPNEVCHILSTIQSDIFYIGSELATPPTKKQKKTQLDSNRISVLEKCIDQWEEQLPPLKHFILPSGTQAAVACHIARTVCRRAERYCSIANEHEPISDHILSYINRLSDFLFVLSRYLNHKKHIEEDQWIPKKTPQSPNV